MPRTRVRLVNRPGQYVTDDSLVLSPMTEIEKLALTPVTYGGVMPYSRDR